MAARQTTSQHSITYERIQEAHRSIVKDKLHIFGALHVRRNAANCFVVVAGLDP